MQSVMLLFVFSLSMLLSLAVCVLLIAVIVSGLRLSRNIKRFDQEIWKSITKGFPFIFCPMPGLLKRLEKSMSNLSEELRDEALSYINKVKTYLFLFIVTFTFLALSTSMLF